MTNQATSICVTDNSSHHSKHVCTAPEQPSVFGFRLGRMVPDVLISTSPLALILYSNHNRIVLPLFMHSDNVLSKVGRSRSFVQYMLLCKFHCALGSAFSHVTGIVNTTINPRDVEWRLRIYHHCTAYDVYGR